MQAVSWYDYSVFIFIFKSLKVGQEGGKLQKFDYVKNQKNVLGE